MMSEENKKLLRLVRSVLRDETIDQDSIQELDYNNLFTIACRNSIANTIADVVCNLDCVASEIKEKFRKQRDIEIARSVVVDNSLQELYSSLDECKVKGVFLKGAIVKKLYLKDYFRSMSDIDIYSEKVDMETIHSLMIGKKFETGAIDRNNHYEYSQGKLLKYEFHPELVAINSAYGQRIFKKVHPNEKDIAAYMNIWNCSIPIEGHEYARQLVPEYHYLYVIMHMANHFLTAGTGIRSIMDIWVMNSFYEKRWNRNTIDSLLKDYGLWRFEQCAFAVANKWFGETDTKLPDGIGIQMIEMFEDYILGSGTYGTSNHAIAQKLNHETSRSAKTKYLFGRIFLPYDQMKGMYPVLKKVPVLLPVMWCKRIGDMLIKRGNTTKTKLKILVNTDDKTIEGQKELMDMLINN